jgi:threonine dehydrogenase-like Zn-dependent dehydrogenase
MDVDPLVSLAVSLHAAPGTFALLVGSGISSSARIPTGWDVVVDLMRKVAVLTDGTDPSDPVAWFTSRGGNPDYSTILERLAPTTADRRNLLHGYFEPTPDEREEGVKTPTRAHRSIAQLVASGHIKVIVTTNFDRLLEAALQEAGIEPIVVSSAAAAVGAIPLAHTKCTILKLHGDYLDPDLKNTVAELGQYDPEIDALLDRILDEYGLLICGWSGVWDEALRNAILRARNRRYGTYWSRVGDLDERAQQLVAHRRATQIVTDGADALFDQLASKVAALDDLTMARPLSTAIAIGQLKRYLPDPTHRIRLHDLVMNEVSRVLALPTVNANIPQPNPDNVAERMHQYEGVVSTLVPLIATTAYFADRDQHDELLVDAIARLARRAINYGGYTIWSELELYPAMLALYSLTIGAVARGRVRPLALVFAQVKVPHPNGGEPTAQALASWRVLDGNACNALVAEPGKRQKTPVSDYLHRLFVDVLETLVPSTEFDKVFDEAEYLLGVVCTAQCGRGPIGRFVWRHHDDGRDVADVVTRHREELLAAGAFETIESIDTAVEQYAAEMAGSGLRW